MKRTREELTALFTLEEFPRSATCDPMWTLENVMGPNVIWRAEALNKVMELRPGTR